MSPHTRSQHAPGVLPHPKAQAGSTFLITGGLGGLGLRAATMLERHERVTRLVLTSRSGQVARDGQGLAAQLKALRASTLSIFACDVADAAHVLNVCRCVTDINSRSLSLLHAAGVGVGNGRCVPVQHELGELYPEPTIAADLGHYWVGRAAKNVNHHHRISSPSIIFTASSSSHHGIM